MIRKVTIVIFSMLMILGIMAGCNKSSNPSAPAAQRTVLFSEGFESQADTALWRPTYMINAGDFYPQMRITADAAHTGTHSVTTDSNRTALLYYIDPRVETGTVGVEFYIMAKTAGQANFTVEIGLNAGSSGGLGKSFGLGFDQNDSVKCTYYDSYTGQNDTMIGAIQPNHWYKCDAEVNFTAQTITYYLEGATVRTRPLPTQEMYGIDRLLVFRGSGPNMDAPDGPKPYFADDIVLYTK